MMEQKQVYQTNTVTQHQRAYTITYTNHQGKRHLVVPVVIMVPGVHNGSYGPVLHTAEELARFPESWNGIPVVIGHPSVNGEYVCANTPDVIDRNLIGRIYNAVYVDNRLRAEAWIDEARLRTLNAGLLTHLIAGQPLDVSMGAYSDQEEVTGVWSGETYMAVSHNYRPDHLALLPNHQGACGWADGCGVRTNAAADTINERGGISMDKGIFNGMLASGYLLHQMVSSIQANQQVGYRERVMAVQRKIDSMDGPDISHYVEEVYEDSVIYRVESRGMLPSILYKRPYTIDAQGIVTLSGDPVPVVKRVEYTVVVQNNSVGDGNVVTNTATIPATVGASPEFIRTKGVQMETNKDKTLEGATVVVNAIPSAPTPATVVPPQATPVANAAPQLNDDQVMALFTPARRAQVEKGMALYTAHRQDLITHILSNTTVYTQQDLDGVCDVGLEKIAQIVKPRADYSVAGGVPQTNTAQVGELPLLPPGVSKSK